MGADTRKEPPMKDKCAGIACNQHGVALYHMKQQDCPICDIPEHSDPGIDICALCLVPAIAAMTSYDLEGEWGHQHPTLVTLNPHLLTVEY